MEAVPVNNTWLEKLTPIAHSRFWVIAQVTSFVFFILLFYLGGSCVFESGQLLSDENAFFLIAGLIAVLLAIVFWIILLVLKLIPFVFSTDRKKVILQVTVLVLLTVVEVGVTRFFVTQSWNGICPISGNQRVLHVSNSQELFPSPSPTATMYLPPDLDEAWSVYKNQELGYQIHFPATWEKREESTPDGVKALTLSYLNQNKTNILSIRISATPESRGDTLKYSYYENLKLEPTTLGGYPAEFVRKGTASATVYDYTVLREGMYYRITTNISGSPEVVKSIEQTATEVVETFSFTPRPTLAELFNDQPVKVYVEEMHSLFSFEQPAVISIPQNQTPNAFEKIRGFEYRKDDLPDAMTLRTFRSLKYGSNPKLFLRTNGPSQFGEHTTLSSWVKATLLPQDADQRAPIDAPEFPPPYVTRTRSLSVDGKPAIEVTTTLEDGGSYIEKQLVFATRYGIYVVALRGESFDLPLFNSIYQDIVTSINFTANN